MNQRFSPSAVENTLTHIHGPMPHGRPLERPTGDNANNAPAHVVGKAVSEASQVNEAALTAEQKKEATLRSIKSAGMMPAQYEFFGMLGGGGLGWVAKKLNWNRAEAAVGMVAKAPVHALRKTDLAHALQFPGTLFGEASNEAKGKASAWETSTANRSKTLLASAENAETAIAKHAEPYLTKMGAGLDRLQATGIGQRVTDTLGSFINWRKNAAEKKHATAIADAHETLRTETTGMRAKVTNLFKGEKPAQFGAEAIKTSHLGEVFQGLEELKDHTTGAAQAKHLHSVIGDLEAKMKGNALTDEVKARGGKVMKHLQKALSGAKALENYETDLMKNPEAATSLKSMVATMAKAVGHIPLYNALLTVGITAGVGAVLVAGHGESKEAKAALKKLNAELPDQQNSGFMKSIKAAEKSGKHWGVAKTGMRLVGEVAEGAMWMSPHAGAGMMGAMMLPQLCEMMVPGNTMLGALEALDKSDKGTLAIKPSDRIQLLTQVIGGMESVAAHGGQYNRLAKSMAAEMQERGFKYHDVVQVLGNDAAFNKMASEISTKQQAEAAKIAAEVKAPEPAVAATPSHMAAALPTTRIGVAASGAKYEGRVAHNHQLKMA